MTQPYPALIPGAAATCWLCAEPIGDDLAGRSSFGRLWCRACAEMVEAEAERFAIELEPAPSFLNQPEAA